MTQLDLSVCIVTLNARDYLKDCLCSLVENTQQASFEVIVVDNASKDGVEEMLCREFPQVHFSQFGENGGYTRPMNQALRAGQGRYLVQLNPDTVILPGALDTLVRFLDAHPEVGVCGPKVLNRDGSLQRPCRRGESTPWAVISYFTGLWALFPKSKLFGGYLMNYMPEDEIHETAGVSGSCMFMRRETVSQVGYLDERFFAYQEDADFCFRARQAGWKVYYVPEARIIHYGGQGGSKTQPYRSIYEWHRSYWNYYRKNLAKNYFFLFNGFFFMLILFKLLLALLSNLVSKEKHAGPRR